VSWKPLSFSRIREIEEGAKREGTKVRLYILARPGILNPVDSIPVSEGDEIHFITPQIEAMGKILSIDLGALLAVKVEYHNDAGDKRIVSFNPDEFISIEKE
jgi:hypothetical protein